MMRQPSERRLTSHLSDLKHLRPAAVAGALAAVATVLAAVSVSDAQEKRRSADRAVRDDLELFADPNAILDGNEFRCGLRNTGDICSEVFTGPFGSGGFWPSEAPNPYVFNSGFQVAGIVGDDGGPWTGDTTGAYFFDLRGIQPHGTPLTDIFDSTDPGDLDAWPEDARIRNGDLFRSEDLGRAAVSEQDTWVRYWDGDPRLLSLRDHPMGVRVAQRSLQWRYPSGNESVIYFLVDLTNVSAEEEFQQLNEAEFFAMEDELPNEGFTLSEVHVGWTADMDVTTNALQNVSTAILPFDLAVSYHERFAAPSFTYSPQLFYPPFFTNAPGIVGIKVLTTPDGPEGTPVGPTFWTVLTGSAVGFPAPLGTQQLWRYMSGSIDPAAGDSPCSVPPEVTGATPAQASRSLCWTDEVARDTRFLMATGPFDLASGETETIAVAYVVAPTLATLPNGSPTGVTANASVAGTNLTGIPSFHPGFPSARDCTDETATDCTETDPVNDVRPIERAAGWVSYDGPAPSTALESPAQKLDPFAVETATHSLLDRALVAQAVFDAKFLRPMPPERPPFHLLPGDGAATIVWEPSPTDETGDSFYELAGDPSSPLYNPNYRQFDVQAYEIWRGTSPEDLEVIAVFAVDEPYVDHTCETVPPDQDLGLGAGPGYSIGEACPDGFEQEVPAFRVLRGFDPVFNNGVPGGRPGRGVVRSAAGTSAFASELRPFPLPEWGELFPHTGSIAYVHRDADVTNNFTYFYAVTAVDLNSPASGPPTQRSERIVRSVIPRAEAPNLAEAEFSAAVVGGDGEPLDPSAPIPTIDPETGTFDGPFPPAAGIELGFVPLLPELLPTLDLQLRIDSVLPDEATIRGSCPNGTNAVGSCWRIHTSAFDGGMMIDESVIPGTTPVWSLFGEPAPLEFQIAAASVPFDQDALAAFGIPSDASGASDATATAQFQEAITYSAMEGQLTRRSATGDGVHSLHVLHGGSRWFDGTTETVADPTAFGSVGRLEGIDTVWAPIHNTPLSPGFEMLTGSGAPCFSYALSMLSRAADVQFTWQGGTFGEARDVTHRTDVEFKPTVQASWGFLNEDANGNGSLDWDDFNYVENVSPIIEQIGFCNHTFDPAATVQLERAPVIRDVNIDTSVDPALTNPLPATGQGFGLYVNGERYIFVTDAVPSDGTQWTLRTYVGAVTTPDDQDSSPNPSGYGFTTDVPTMNSEDVRSVLIPGLTFRYTIEAATNFDEPVDLARVHTVPDPYLFASAYDGGDPAAKELVFVNLPPRATVRIYTLGGILVDVIDHDDPTRGGRAPWDLRNRGGQYVASGVYFFHVMTPEGEDHVGKFTIVNPHRN